MRLCAHSWVVRVSAAMQAVLAMSACGSAAHGITEDMDDRRGGAYRAGCERLKPTLCDHVITPVTVKLRRSDPWSYPCQHTYS